MSFFSVWVFFREHSPFIGQQGKGETISLTSLYHFHPLHEQLDISRAITVESSPLHITSSPTQTGKLWFPSREQFSYTTKVVSLTKAVSFTIELVLKIELRVSFQQQLIPKVLKFKESNHEDNFP